jgi:hypothetical protein
MMGIYLVHARHGKKIATMEKEAEADKKNGWKEVTPEQFYPAPKKEGPKPTEVSADKERADLAATYSEKFGKAPHHRMSNDTIREALNDSAEA